jgi:GTP-binding protein Era
LKCGFLTLLGLPNAGKSSLLNTLVGEGVAIVTPKAQTTWTLMRGYMSEPDLQAVITDTPGLQAGTKAINQALTKNVSMAVKSAIQGNECIALVVDAYAVAEALEQKKPTELQKIFESLSMSFGKLPLELPAILVLNKADRLRFADARKAVEEHARSYVSRLFVATDQPYVWLSTRTGSGISEFKALLHRQFPEGTPGSLFDPDDLSDQSIRSMASEFIREQCFMQLGSELPYAVAVQIEQFDESSGPIPRVEATLHVERESQKAIVIGKGGLKLRSLGAAARQKIETLVDKQIFLGLKVKVTPHWSREQNWVKRFGYLQE